MKFSIKDFRSKCDQTAVSLLKKGLWIFILLLRTRFSDIISSPVLV